MACSSIHREANQVLFKGNSFVKKVILNRTTKLNSITYNMVFSMPEAAIGHFPDVGASYFLSRLPGYFGEYLGLTGARLDGSEMVACGLASHFGLSKDLHHSENELEGVSSSNTTAISQLISKFEYEPYMKQDTAYTRLKIVDECFFKETVEDILFALVRGANNSEWGRKMVVDAINSMKSASPTSLKIFLRSIREGRWLSLEQCYIQECILFCHVVRGTVSHDFFEGVRAKLVDKDQNPKRQPSELKQVSEEMIERCFNQVNDDDWEYLQLPNRADLEHKFGAIFSKL